MPVSQRAKQFMPFAAVVGLDEAIRRVEEKVDNSSEVERIPENEEIVIDDDIIQDEDI